MIGKVSLSETSCFAQGHKHYDYSIAYSFGLSFIFEGWVLSVCPFVRVSVCPYICRLVCLSVRIFVYSCVRLFVYQWSVIRRWPIEEHQNINRSVFRVSVFSCVWIYIRVYIFSCVCMSVCLSVLCYLFVSLLSNCFFARLSLLIRSPSVFRKFDIFNQMLFAAGKKANNMYRNLNILQVRIIFGQPSSFTEILRPYDRHHATFFS